jgi:hypothetical protein
MIVQGATDRVVFQDRIRHRAHGIEQFAQIRATPPRRATGDAAFENGEWLAHGNIQVMARWK